MSDDINRVAIVTPSYHADFERCRLLCESMDRFVEQPVDHYILVDDADYVRFTDLSGRRRNIINEMDLLPSWLHNIRQGMGRNARRLWFSRHTWPMRGWHVQQLRRIAIAFHVAYDGLLYCDSDALFVKPFSTNILWQDDHIRLYRKDGGITEQQSANDAGHTRWTRAAARLNGLEEPGFPAHDYIQNLVSWRREDIVNMCRHIEEVTGRHWLAAIGRNRTFSECQIYGAYVDGVLQGHGHWHASNGLCRTYWSGDALCRQDVDAFVAAMDQQEVAIGIQSFTNTEPDMLRHLLTA